MFFADFHCDTITTAMKKKEGLLKNSCHIDIKKLKSFNFPVQVFSIWLEKEKLHNPYLNTMEAIRFFKREVLLNSKDIEIAKNFSDVENNIKNKKISGIIGIEGCEAFEGKVENIYDFFEAGVRVFTLTWNYENELGFGAVTENKSGLKPFGKETVKILNELNGIIDVSHLNEKGFWDICDISERPFIASHSNSKKICDNARNLSDEQIIEISRRKGIIGINLYPFFLIEDGNSDISSIIKHIDYIINIAGEDVLGIGCDFDGVDVLPRGISSVLDINKIYEAIVLCFNETIADKIMGNNFTRFFRNNML